MSSQLILYSYFAAAVVALLLALWRACRWYWHVLAIAVGVCAALLPPWGAGSNAFYLITGTVAVFFSLWGLAGLFVRRRAF